MKNLQKYIEFVELESQQQQMEIQNRAMLSNRALNWLGYAIDNLKIVKIDNYKVELDCAVNNSRFRPGDKLLLINSAFSSFKAVLFEVHNSGRKIVLSGTKMQKYSQLVSTEGWTAIEDYSDLTYSIQTALRKLMPGAPGWTFAKYLLGKQSPQDPKSEKEHKDLLDLMSKEVNLHFDKTKREVFLNCLACPAVYGIQGPPGTGKTYMLAIVAEALIRMGKRVVILAPTHQAVNNALSTLTKYFRDRSIKKYGDELRKESLIEEIPIITNASYISQESPDTIIGMTFMAALHHLMIGKKKMISPNVLIIDEAGQLPLVQGLCAGLSGAGSIILFGDDKQMPPVISSELSEDPRAVSLFAQLRLTQPKLISILDITYRLNEQLCAAIGKTFYSGANLYPDTKASIRKLSLKKINKQANSWVNNALSPLHSLVWLQVPSSNYTQVNPKEAEAVVKLVSTCLEGGLNIDDIAVVTPFRRQVMHIKYLMSQQNGNWNDLPIIDTVERVQGLTVEVVIVSMCSSDREYIKTIADFLYSSNRMNVAISRAKTKAIVVSNPNVFKVIPQYYSGLIARNLCHTLLTAKTTSIIKYPV